MSEKVKRGSEPVKRKLCSPEDCEASRTNKRKKLDVEKSNVKKKDGIDVVQEDSIKDGTAEASTKTLSDGELAELRAQLKRRQKAAMQAPKLFLTLDKLESEVDARWPTEKKLSSGQPLLFLADLQHLLLNAVQGNLASYKPRWCSLVRPAKISHVALFVLDGVSASDFNSHRDCFPFVSQHFSMSIEMDHPGQSGRTAVDELFQVPLSARRLKTAGFAVHDMAGGEKCMNGEERASTLRYGELISRLDLILSEQEMRMERYPVPSVKDEKTKGYVYTKTNDKYPTDLSPMFGLDCEMCQTTCGQGELTRVAITNEEGKCVLDVLVKPRNEITDYRTQYSGITRKMLEHVTTRIEAVQRRIRELLPPDAILVGQSLDHDLHALKMFHPYVIDTALIYNTSGLKGKKTSLRELTSTFLNRKIQTGGKLGHDPCEDSLAALELVQLKLKKGLEFGNVLWKGALRSSSDNVRNRSDIQQDIVADKHSDKIRWKKWTGSSSKGSKENKSSDGYQTSAQARMNFFARASANMLYADFFELARKENKSVAVGGFGDSLPSDLCTIKLSSETDHELVRQCREALTCNFMVCAQFNAARLKDQLDLNAALRKLDKRVRKVMKRLELGALALVLLSGDDELRHNALCLLTVT